MFYLKYHRNLHMLGPRGPNSVRRYVHLSVFRFPIIFNRGKTRLPVFRGRRNSTRTKKISRTSIGKTSQTGFSQQIRYGNLLAYLARNRPSAVLYMLFCSKSAYIYQLSKVQLVSDGPTGTLSRGDARTHLKLKRTSPSKTQNCQTKSIILKLPTSWRRDEGVSSGVVVFGGATKIGSKGEG